MKQLALIPPPLRVGARTIRCPDCTRTYPRRRQAAYELHWRLAHGVDPQPRHAIDTPPD